MDMTIHPLLMPEVNEYQYFRGNKGIHFMNTLSMVDFQGKFLHVEPGFLG